MLAAAPTCTSGVLLRSRQSRDLGVYGPCVQQTNDVIARHAHDRPDTVSASVNLVIGGQADAKTKEGAKVSDEFDDGVEAVGEAAERAHDRERR